MRKPTVLVVEDERLVAFELEMALEDAGYLVVGKAANATDAITLLQQQTPDLALLDIALEDGSSGLDVAAWILENKPSIPLIYLTGQRDRETREAAVKTQPRVYLTKPFREEDLLPNIELALTQQAQQVIQESGATSQVVEQQSAAEPPGEFSRETAPAQQQADADSPADAPLTKLGRSTFFITGNTLYIKRNDFFEKVPLQEIAFLQADSNYTHMLVRSGQKFTFSKTLKVLEEYLPEQDFARISRSYIVNLDAVEQFSDKSIVVEGHELQVSKSHQGEFFHQLLNR